MTSANKRLLLSCIAFSILFLLLYPWYKYVFDPDATGYLKVAERIAQGDYTNAINGYWSPLNSWLLVPFLKMGCNAITTAKLLDGIYGLGTLISIHFLLKKFTLHRFTVTGILTAATIMLLHMAFYELFGDLLNVLLLTIYLNIICSEDFIISNKKIILASVILGFAYYAKYYSFYFGIVFTLPLFFVLLKKKDQTFPFKQWLIKVVLACGILFIMVLPWAITLASKYGHFTFTTSAQLNQSFRLSEAYQQPKILSMPLPYADSYSYWDDPSYHYQGIFIWPFMSKVLFLHQLKIIISSALVYIHLLNDFSFILLAVLLLCILLWLTGRKEFLQNKNNYLVLLFVLILPLGYFLTFMDYRYIWSIYFCGLILCGVLLSLLHARNWLTEKIFMLSCIVLFGSFCFYPIDQLQNQRYAGKNIYAITSAFQSNNIKGRFITNYTSANDQGSATVLGYLLHSQYYGPSAINITEAEYLQVIKENKIDYCFMFYQLPYQEEAILSSGLAKKATAVLPNIYPGIVVLSYK